MKQKRENAACLCFLLGDKADFLHRLGQRALGKLARTLGALTIDDFKLRLVAHVAVVFRLNRLKRCDDGVGDGVFQIAVALAREFLDGGVGRLAVSAQ